MVMWAMEGWEWKEGIREMAQGQAHRHSVGSGAADQVYIGSTKITSAPEAVRPAPSF